jgi:ATP synthase protein I
MKFFKDLDREYLNNLVKASVVGLHLVTATFVGLAVGYYLDKWLGTKPWLTMLFLLFGIAAGFMNMYREVKGIHQRDADKPRSEHKQNGSSRRDRSS